MKKSIFITICFVLLQFIGWSFGDKETRSLASFDQVSVATGIQAILQKGSVNKIAIEAEGVDLDKVITEVRNGKLVVKIESNWWGGWSSKRKVEVIITHNEDLEAISSSSGASIESQDVIAHSAVELSASSGPRLALQVDTQDLEASVSSGANMEISGKAAKAEISSSSGASFNDYDLEIEKADLSASSGASIKVAVLQSLRARASSGGSVRYKGNPEYTDIDKSSGGSVKSY